MVIKKHMMIKGKKSIELIERCAEIWEAAVRATHHFVKESDIVFYRPYVRQNCDNLPLLLHHEGDEVVAFLGLDSTYIDMLFVHPDYRGKGIGRKLVQRAVDEYHAETLTVNEQNEQALGFYLKLGFEVQSRSALDGFGFPYPLLHMRLKNPRQRLVKVMGDKKAYLSLLLLADPSEEMVDRYLPDGEMFILERDGQVIGEAVVDAAGEIKNLAVAPDYQRQYFGRYILAALAEHYKDRFDYLWVGTSDYGTVYYEQYGFECDHVVKNFFTDNYPEPIIEDGRQCVDMVYLKRKIR